MRRRAWLWIALALIVVATALMLWAEGPSVEPLPEQEVTIPRRAKAADYKRMESRRTLPVQEQPGAGADAPPPLPQDPLLVAIANGKGTAVVVEANAIRHSPIGQLMLDCLRAEARDEGERDPIEVMKEELGVDPLKDLDRVAMTDEGLVLSGDFKNARWTELFGARAQTQPYGMKGTIYRNTRPDGGVSGPAFVTWGDQLAVVADDDEAARAAIDRLEGRAGGTPLITEELTYGEIYGVLSAEDLARMMPPGNEELAARLQEAAGRVELHVDTSSDVGMVARVQGPDALAVEDLGKTIGGAMSLARLRAKADGEDELAQFLDLALVRPGEGTFSMELALPMELLEQQLAFCRDENLRAQRRADQKARREARAAERANAAGAEQPADTASAADPADGPAAAEEAAD